MVSAMLLHLPANATLDLLGPTVASPLASATAQQQPPTAALQLATLLRSAAVLVLLTAPVDAVTLVRLTMHCP